MTFTLSLLGSLFLALASSSPPPIGHKTVPSPGYVSLPIRGIPRESKHRLDKRENEVPLVNFYDGWEYAVRLEMGSNHQPVDVAFDTGSDLFWVNPDCDDMLKSLRDRCDNNLRYDPHSSSSVKQLKKSFYIYYEAGEVSGRFYTDDITIGQSIIKAQQFGIANDGLLGKALGILGVMPNQDRTHKSFVESLVDQDQVESGAFGVDLRSLNETGSVIFGGIDAKKYKCHLTRLDTLHEEYHVELTNIGQTLPNGERRSYIRETGPFNVLLDTGAQYNELPSALAYEIAADYPDARYTSIEGYGHWEVPCNPPEGTFDFTFGDKTISVPYSAMIVHFLEKCHLGVTVASYDFSILGDPFLRGVYAVFDWENDHIWLDEKDDCGSEVHPIRKGRYGVPVVPGCNCGERSA